jgi:hypothetical protein
MFLVGEAVGVHGKVKKVPTSKRKLENLLYIVIEGELCICCKDYNAFSCM